MSFEFREFADDYISSLVKSLEEIPIGKIEELWKMVEETRDSGNTIHFIGNGGSAGTPSHSAGDWSKELMLRTISHTDNSPSLTAWANDTDYENVFFGQLSTFLREGDLVIGFSGSGNSVNVLNGITYAKNRDCRTVAMTGNLMGMSGGKLAEISDLAIIAPSDSMERIEDLHLIINHIIKEAVKKKNRL